MDETNSCYVNRYNLKNTAKIIVPLFFSSVAVTLMMSIDRIVLGMYSLNAMNAVSLVGSYTAVISFFLCSITSISAVFVGQFNGEYQFKKTPIAVWQMVHFSLFTIPILALISIIVEKYCFLPKIYIADGMAYMQMLTIFGFIPPLFTAISSFFIGRKKTVLVTLTVVAENIINLILDIILVFGIDGYIKPMGTVGAGIATVFSNVLGVIFIFCVFLRKKNREHFETSNCKINKNVFLDCLKIGTPLAFDRALNLGAWFLVFLLVGHVSNDLATLESITITFYLMLSCYTECLNKGAAVISANLIGEGRMNEVHRTFKTFMNINSVFSIIVAIPLIFYQDLLFFWLGKLNGDVSHLRNELVFIFYALYFVILADAVAWIISGILTSGGDTVYPAVVNTALLWIIVVCPTAYMYYFGTLNSMKEINLCSALCSAVTATVLFYRYKEGKWKKTIV